MFYPKQEWQSELTCGLCGSVCDDYVGHGCLYGYDDAYVDQNNYFYPELPNMETIVTSSRVEDGILRLFYISSKEHEDAISCQHRLKEKKNLTQPQKAKKDQKHGELNDDEVEMLLLEVEHRIPLWDFDLPIELRSKETVAALWQEVSDALNGRLSAEDSKKKFMSLHDTYRKIIWQEHQARYRSPRITTYKNWTFYMACEFLRDSCLLKPTSSNVTGHSDGQVSDNESAMHVDLSGDSACIMENSLSETFSQLSASTRGKKERSRADDTVENQSMQALNKIADTMSKETPPLVLPKRPTMDTIDHLLCGAIHEIRKLPERIQFDTCMQVLNLINSISRQYYK